MHVNKNLRQTLTVKWKIFCQHSTLHGVYYFYSSKASWVHATWALVIISGMGLCCFLSHMIWGKYAVDPTLTVVETTRFSITNIPYPAVTVCDTEMVYGPNTKGISEILELRGYNKSQVVEFFESFTSVKHKEYSPPPYVRKMHGLLEDLGFAYKLLLDMLKKPCDKLVIDCAWRSKTINCSEMFRPVYTFAGYCCQFDVPYFRNNTKENISFISGNRINEALQLVVDGRKTNSEGNTTNGLVLLFVYDQTDKVTLMNSYITLTPSAYFDVNVYAWTIDSSSNVKDLSIQSRKCVLDSDPDIGAKFYQACMTRLTLQKVVSQCRCLPFDYTYTELGVDDYSSCNWEKLSCIYENIEEVQSTIRHIVSNSQCYQKCDYVEYGTEVEYMKIQRNLRAGIGDQSHVSVHFNENTCFKYRREILYTWDQMLANLGGIFGLCLGGSIISVIELLWYFMDTIMSVFQFTANRKINSTKGEKAKAEDNVFIVTKKKFSPQNIKTRPYKFVN